MRLHCLQGSVEELVGGGWSEPCPWSSGVSLVALNVASSAPAFSGSSQSRGASVPAGFKSKHSGKYPARECLGVRPL